MEIRLMDKKSFELSKTLWQICFPEDGSEFVDWYYSERTKPEYALGAFENSSDMPIAMLHMLPRPMRFNGEERRVCFVAGVATHPAFRRRGICTRLFDSAFDIMRERGYEASVLQPFDPGFYERLGFKTYAFLNKVTVSGEWPICAVRPAERIKPDPERLEEQYSGFTKGFEGCSVRGAEYFKGFIEEFSLPGARLAASKHGCCAGYEEGEGFTVYELFADSHDIGCLLSLLPSGYGRVTFFLPEQLDISPLLRLLPDRAVCERVPFCMLAPIAAGFETGSAPKFCIDRY